MRVMISKEREQEIRNNLPAPNWITVPLFAKRAIRELLGEIDRLRLKNRRQADLITQISLENAGEVRELTKEVSCLRESLVHLWDEDCTSEQVEVIKEQVKRARTKGNSESSGKS